MRNATHGKISDKPVAGPIFGPRSFFNKRLFMNEISSSASSYLIFNWHYCVSIEWIHYPRIRTFVEKKIYCLFSKKKALKSGGFVSGCFVIEIKLRSTPCAEQNFPDEITWITWKAKQNLKIWPFLKSDLEISLWESGRKLVLLAASYLHRVELQSRRIQPTESPILPEALRPFAVRINCTHIHAYTHTTPITHFVRNFLNDWI